MFGKTVLEMGFRRVHMRRREGLIYKEMTDSPGWFSSAEAKRDLLSDYRSALSLRQYINRAHESMSECLYYVHTTKGTIEHSKAEKNTDLTGARHNHGDRVIADALSWMMIRGMAREAVRQRLEIGPPMNSLAWRREQREIRRRLKEA